MLKLSARSEYALRVIDFLRRNKTSADIRAISVGTGVPESLLRKIIGRLVVSGILISQRGRSGGISMEDKLYSLYEVLVAMGEDISLVKCTHESCSEIDRCGISTTLKRVQK